MIVEGGFFLFGYFLIFGGLNYFFLGLGYVWYNSIMECIFYGFYLL